MKPFCEVEMKADDFCHARHICPRSHRSGVCPGDQLNGREYSRHPSATRIGLILRVPPRVPDATFAVYGNTVAIPNKTFSCCLSSKEEEEETFVLLKP